MRIYPYIVGLIAIGIAACAAFFSVTGYSQLFGGNQLTIAIMMGFLEAGKLVCASAAYRFRKIAPIWTKIALYFFTIVMMVITSTGIFGYLSSSYEEVSQQLELQETRK